MVQHMGHTNERARGDSRLQDWPDAIWRLVREDDEPGSPRFFSAYGRDVDLPEGRLNFDPDTRHLAYIDGSRKDAKTDAATPDVVAILAEDAQQGGEGLSGRAMETAACTGEHTRQAVRKALATLIRQGLVTVVAGPKRSKLHRITNPCADCGYPLAAGQEDRHIACAAAQTDPAVTTPAPVRRSVPPVRHRTPRPSRQVRQRSYRGALGAHTLRSRKTKTNPVRQRRQPTAPD